MKVLRNHFQGKPTILIDNLIINGCQIFTLENAPAILKRYNVPEEVWQEVLDNYTGTSTEEEVLKYVDDKSWRVRMAIAEQGYALEQLKDDKVNYVRRAVARQGYALEQLKYDKVPFVRIAVAEQGYALEQLKDDIISSVRVAVARQGYALEQLKNDEDAVVRHFSTKMLDELNK